MCYNSGTLAQIVNCVFKLILLPIIISKFLTAHHVWKIHRLYILYVLIHSPFCILNFMLPASTAKFAEVAYS